MQDVLDFGQACGDSRQDFVDPSRICVIPKQDLLYIRLSFCDSGQGLF